MEPKPFAGYRPILVEELRRVLAGEGPLRAVLRYHVGLEDASGAPVEALGKLIRPSLTLLVAEELGGSLDAARAAAVSVALIDAYVKTRSDEGYEDEAEAINAGDFLLSLAFGEANRAGRAVLMRALDACTEWIETRNITAIMRYACVVGGLAAGASEDVMKELDRMGRSGVVPLDSGQLPLSGEAAVRMGELMNAVRWVTEGKTR